MSRSTGVYTITNLITGKIYVGCARDEIRKRWYRHKYYFRKGNHPNKLLRRDVEKYGIDSMLFEVLEECPKHLCIDIEQFWMNMLDSFNPKFGYNMLANSRDSRGLKQDHEARIKMRVPKKKKQSPEDIEKRRQIMLIVCSDPEYRLKQSLKSFKRPVLKFTKDDVFLEEYHSVTSAAKLHGVTSSTITQSCTGRRLTGAGYKWKYKETNENTKQL